MPKSDHKHNYSENALVRHWYRGYKGLTFYCGVAKRCAISGRVNYEKFNWTRPLEGGQQLHQVCRGEDVVRQFPNYPIIDILPLHLADEMKPNGA